MSQSPPKVNLSNCDQEPIHILGLIQPHGAMLVVGEDGRLAFKSDNLEALIGKVPEIGTIIDMRSEFENPQVRDLTVASLDDGMVEFDPQEMSLNGEVFDVMAHLSGDRTIIEFEKHPSNTRPLYAFALDAQKAIGRLTRVGSIDRLIEEATQEIRSLTGFDRVMCYRFRHDDSGEVVAEDKREDLEPFLGLRYPASDIPIQARRLYAVNLLRFIADIHGTPSKIVPECGPDSETPLDLSHSVLRHVSSIHIEYLKNMGVSASMSVSIILNGKLWGLFACHHYSGEKRVPQVVRASCTLLAQMFSTRLEHLLSEDRISRMETTRKVTEDYLKQAVRAEDIFGGFFDPEALKQIVSCDGGAVVFDRQMLTFGFAPNEDVLADLVGWLKKTDGADMVVSHRVRKEFAEVGMFGPVGGLMGIRFSREQDGWVFWFRRVEREEIRWAGNPDKTYGEGEHGSRLSPRGSFAEYLQTVEDHSRPWDPVETEIAGKLRISLQDIAFSRLSEMERARKLLIASLSHDLRNPLFAIDISAQMLSDEAEDKESLGQQISTSSHRMQRLIDQMLDFNRIESGQTLGVTPVETDIDALTRQLISETERAFPGLAIQLESEVRGPVRVDPDRFAQVLSNLLSNTRHHGMLGHPVKVTLEGGDTEPFRMRVRNKADEIPAEIQEGMFRGLKRNRTDRPSNRRGLGIGLYIVHTVIAEHGGTIEMLPYDGYVTFEIVIPVGS